MANAEPSNAATTAGRGDQRGAALEELLAELRAALDPYYGESDPSRYVARYADKVTTFDPWSAGKLEDGPAGDHLLAFAGVIPISDYRVLNPSVDVFGDTAVFTFNVEVVKPEDGAVLAVWNATEVLCSADRGWELVHAHWSFAVPPAEQPDA